MRHSLKMETPYRCYHWLRQGTLKQKGTYMDIWRLIRLLITLPVELSSYSRLALSRNEKEKCKSFNTEGLESGKWKKIIYKNPCQESGLRNISNARYWEKRFTWIYKALYGNAMLVSLSGTPIWPPDTNRNICFRVFLLMREFFAWGTHKDYSNIYSETRDV